MEPKKREYTEEEIREKVNFFLSNFNKNLPPTMELEYEGFYRRGFFLTKKRYAVIEKDKIIAKGLELVRRDWAPIAKQTQEDILRAILREGDIDKALQIIGNNLKQIKTGKIKIEELIIHTQMTKNISDYKQIGPHVIAAKEMADNGIEVGPGTIIRYVITKGKGPISQRATPYDLMGKKSYDPEYYIHNQVLPAVSRIMESLGYTKEDLLDLTTGEKQQSLDAFF